VVRAWLPRTTPARVAVIAVAVVVVLNLVLYLVNQVAGGPTGPDSSSYATAARGVKAYATLLAREGHEVVRVGATLDDVRLPANATVMLLDPGEVSDAEADALATFIRSGGRLVVAAGGDPEWLERVLSEPPTWGFVGPTIARPLVPVPEVANVDDVASAGFGGWRDAGASLPALAAPDGPALMTVASEGAGRAVLLADPSPLQNRLLAARDNAAFGVAIAGGRDRPVLFAERHHGYGRASGLAALPSSWKVALGGLAVAALAYMVAKGRRLGPPEQEGRELPPPRRAYVESLAGILARTQNPYVALRLVRDAARALLVRRAGLSADADEGELRRAAERFGLDEVETRALLSSGRGETDAMAAGRALARLRKGRW
jgi:hypothetical protein